MEKSFFYRESPGRNAKASASERRRGRGVVGAIAWTAGVAGGLLALAAMTSLPPLQRLGRTLTRRDDPDDDQFADWGRKMLGRSKRQVAEALGAPPAASAPTPAPSYWDANTWYYPYNPGEKSAVAIEFRSNRVTRVEYINSPA